MTKYDHIGIGKETRDSKRKIDAVVTAVLAWMARQEIVKNRGVAAVGRPFPTILTLRAPAMPVQAVGLGWVIVFADR
ncbi:hypothetical protein AB0L88_40995 [Saccharopolyspora shandongensis]|uniref:hypothetical protein n=1 Tax=Saccharopolyspora shandongensis TaxID=418495 RepID=UPI00341DAFE3